MKHFMLISILCLLASCGENSKKSQSNTSMGQPYLSVLTPETEVNEILVPVIVENEDTTPVIVENDEEDSVPAEDAIEEVEVVNEEAKSLVCDFSNDNQESSLSLLIKNKMVVLKDSENSKKLTFDGYTFSPSGNENAAVHHEDKNLTIEEGKVLKITARIVMSEDLKTGELQLSYSVKTDDKKTIQTEFRTLADVKNCVQE